MALSTADRQKRHRQKVKAKAVLVRVPVPIPLHGSLTRQARRLGIPLHKLIVRKLKGG